MGDEFTTSGNWWESTRNRFDSGIAPPSTSSIGSFGWLTDMAAASDIKSRSSSSSSSQINLAERSGGCSNLLGAETNLQMMNLALSSQMDWNQPNLLRGDKASSESSFGPILRQENGSSSYGQEQPGVESGQEQWRSAAENFMLQGMLGAENQDMGFENRQINGVQNNNNYEELDYALSSDQLVAPNCYKVPQFLKATKKPPPSGQLQFSNNAPFWNASSAAPPVSDVRPTIFQPVQSRSSSQKYEEKPNKNLLQNSSNQISTTKKSGSEGSNKRPRNETQSLPAFKVKKEKMGDRITALQQLVSPYGKTDTASVLSEAIEYIKFLHEQVHVLSTPYMKTGVAMQHHQKFERSKLDPERPEHDLRSQGLCLVPLSVTFPVTAHETNIDFWNPTFGGTYR